MERLLVVEIDSARYTIVTERGPSGYGAHVPDLPGCVADAATKAEVCVLIREAIEIYLEEFQADGRPIPPPRPYAMMKPSNTSSRK